MKIILATNDGVVHQYSGMDVSDVVNLIVISSPGHRKWIQVDSGNNISLSHVCWYRLVDNGKA